MAAMDDSCFDGTAFAREFGQLFREIYGLAVRRIDDGREALSAETAALLMHLARSGPMTLMEMVRHFHRAPSTLSVKIAALEADGLLARQRDEADARRALIWLSPQGRQALDQAMQVLDGSSLDRAAQRLSPAQRTQLLQGLRALTTALSFPHPPEPGAKHDDDTL